MIRQRTPPFCQRQWGRAIVLSVALHLLAVAPLFWLGARAGGDGPRSLVLNTCVTEGPAVSIALMDEPPRPRPFKPTLAQQQHVDASPPVSSLANAPIQEAAAPTSKDAAPPEPQAADQARTASSRPTNGSDSGWEVPRTPGGASFFALSAPRAQRIVYVIDCSASMGQHGHLDRARQELLASLEGLPASTRFQIVTYNGYAEPLRLGGQTELVPATPAIKLQVAQQLAGLRAAGRTDHVQALRRALELDPEVIFFLTDAGDMKPDEIRKVGQMNQGRAVIHCVELRRGRSGSESPLLQLARGNRGSYQPVVP